MKGATTGKGPACSETPAPVALVVALTELLKVPVAMVVVLGLELELFAIPVELFWETTCWRRKKRRVGGRVGTYSAPILIKFQQGIKVNEA